MDWNGRWQVEATIPGGGAYSGHVDIRPFGAGHTLCWTISDGTYSGVGLAREEGLFVSCGPSPSGLSLLVMESGGAGYLLSADGENAAAESRVKVRGDETGRWVIEGGNLNSVTIEENGASLLARVESGGKLHEGLAWRTRQHVSVAWGAPLERLVILFYPTPSHPHGPVEAQWALGRHRTLAAERLTRRHQ